MEEPCLDIAHVGHLELLTPLLDASTHFFVDVLGMTISGREAGSVYLRAWDDYEFHSLKLTQCSRAGLGHVGLRARTPQALQRRVAALNAAGCGAGWTAGDLGHGPAYRFHDPDGPSDEVYYETKWFDPPPDQRPRLRNQAQRFPARGVNVRRLDHYNLVAQDLKANRMFLADLLGFRLTEMTLDSSGEEAGFWMTATNKSYDLAYGRDPDGRSGRFHHVTFALDSREEILRAADIFIEYGIEIENGPHKHGIQQTFFVYVFEPGGNRVELGCSGARLLLAPDWRPIIWTAAERDGKQAWGLKLSPSFANYVTPPTE